MYYICTMKPYMAIYIDIMTSARPNHEPILKTNLLKSPQ